MDDTKNDVIIDAEIVEEVPSATSASVDSATLLLDLENMINSSLGKIETLTQESQKLSEMLNSVLENDTTYISHLEASKEAARVKNTTKSEISKRPEVAHTIEKIREVKADLKDTKDALSAYLYEYSKVANTDEFEAADGSVRRIVYNAKLVR